jgi:hypothetical protein
MIVNASMDSTFRPLKPEERALIDRLLEPRFQGRDELRLQLLSVSAKLIIADGTLSLECGSGRPASTKYRVAMEAICTDADGVDICVMLHVNKEGFMHMLEIIKYDGSPIINPPTASSLVLIDPA